MAKIASPSNHLSSPILPNGGDVVPMDDQLSSSLTSSTTTRAPPKITKNSHMRFVPILLRKNGMLKWNHPIATLFEILTPVLFIILLSWIKTQVSENTKPDGFSVDQAGSATSLNLFDPQGGSTVGGGFTPKFAIPETTVTGLLLHLAFLSFDNGRLLKQFKPEDRATCYEKVVFGGQVSLNTSSPFAVPEECRGKLSPAKIAIVPDDTFTRNYFYETMKTWYPRVTMEITSPAIPGLNTSTTEIVVPSFEDSIVFFKDEDALDEYVKSFDYATKSTQPSIFGALVFQSYPTNEKDIGKFSSIDYAIRLNATLDTETGTKPEYVLQTRLGNGASEWKPFDRNIDRLGYTIYAANGFMTLQTLVSRFVNCMPEYDSSTKSAISGCQVNQSTAISSDELDNRLLKSIASDVSFKATLYDRLNKSTTLLPEEQEQLYLSVVSIDSKDISTTLTLEDEAKEALLTPLRQAPQSYLGNTVSPYPVQKYDYSLFYNITEIVFPLFFLITYMHMFSSILVNLITERETRSKELMKILGVKESSIVMSWYITYTIVVFLAAVCQTIAAKIGMFEASDPFVLFLFFFLFSLSLLSLAFLVSSIFSKARTGIYVGVIGVLAMYTFAITYNETTSTESSKNSACILAPTALVFGVKALASVETSGVGMNFSNIGLLVDNFRFVTAMYYFAFDAFLYLLLSLYLERVVPKAYGTTKKWYFLFSPTYWGKKRSKGKDVLNENQANTEDFGVINVNDSNFEEVSADLREQERNQEILAIRNVRKVFKVPGGEKEVVKSVNLNVYKNQITCLLGHNGAGKSTLISMLTGVYDMTSGDAFFHGLSIKNDMATVRESLGICFQHDVLYPELTVQDHLEFYGRIKGYTGADLAREVKHKMKEVGLLDKKDAVSDALSGGMKRKLSVAIALLGDNSLVFLDEPTSGMDPYSRRSTWEMLMNNRQNRVMVLTTHFMDEADVLGDRIAIMSEGEVKCCGSPLFLKEKYGAGYNLTLVKEEGCPDRHVISFVSRHIPQANVLSNVGTEISFQLPLDASSAFPSMFQELDDSLQTLRVISYGISVTTMEEVFIKVAELSDEDNQHTLAKAVKDHDEYAAMEDDNNHSIQNDSAPAKMKKVPGATGMELFWIQMFALIQKRSRIARRDKRTLLVSLLLPIAWLVFAFSANQADPINKADPLMPLNFDGLVEEISPSSSKSILVPSSCMVVSENADNENPWCNAIVNESSKYFTDATIVDIPTKFEAYDTNEPTVFGVKYTSPAIDRTDGTGHLLKLSEEIYDRGFVDGIKNQFGGFLVYADEDSQVFSYDLLINTTLKHGSVVLKNLMDQSLYRFMASNTEASNTDLKLTASSYPLPETAKTGALYSAYISFGVCFQIVLAFAFFPAPIVSLVVKEREAAHNSKHQQLVSGAGLTAFWIANYVFDYLIYLIPMISTIILLVAYPNPSLTGTDECISCEPGVFTATLLLLILGGLAICPYAYVLSFAFKQHASAQMYVVIFNIIVGLIFVMTSFFLSVIPQTVSTNDVLIWFFRLSPLFNLGNGLLNLTIIEIVNTGGGEWEREMSNAPFAPENAGNAIGGLIFNSIVYFALAIMMDYALTFPKFKSMLSKDPAMPVRVNDNEDQDVAAEAERLNAGGELSDIVQLRQLRKVYRWGHKLAVNQLSFGLKQGECFGFLGINGAGKTTTMKMLTGDIVPSSGGATLGGYNILTQPAEIRQLIGYCPQFDALIDLLSVREHLELFAKIKGVRSDRLDQVVREKMTQLNLLDFEDKLAGTLSGGNKRKLSVAIALIGSPSIIFLDEPSTGMDPVSRRFMWDVISEISTYNKESTVMLTTHSMEECEALCTRVGIMVNGELKCLGSIQHLKNRFGDGLMFDAKLQAPTANEVKAIASNYSQNVNSKLSRSQVKEMCGVFGNASWFNKIINTHPTGYMLANQLSRDEYVLVSTFATWWLMEVRFDRLSSFLHQNFPSVELLERRNDSCWYKIRESATKSEKSLKLAQVFTLIEDAKVDLHLHEYSFSQTTLEQIFNMFASQQTEGKPIANTPTGTQTAV